MGIGKAIGYMLIVCVAFILLGFVFEILSTVLRVVVPILVLAAILFLGLKLLNGGKNPW
ncbi:MAG: hypothetical protein HGA31_06550 [Candidatus Moranbacteria bacterium]|nr:hypothetical protein [Candidatus Moranbacteria bacterium]